MLIRSRDNPTGNMPTTDYYFSKMSQIQKKIITNIILSKYITIKEFNIFICKIKTYLI